MSKTIELRKVVQTKLKTVCSNVFFETAPVDALYPHIVWSMASVDLGDFYRDDIIIDIDIWDRNTDAKTADNLADSVEALFNNKNMPQTNILPTFFRTNRKSVPDEDKKIKHRYISIQVQNYER